MTNQQNKLVFYIKEKHSMGDEVLYFGKDGQLFTGVYFADSMDTITNKN